MATRFDGVGTFAEDALLAYWDGDGEETAPRTLADGSERISAALGPAAFGGGRPEILVSSTTAPTACSKAGSTGGSDTSRSRRSPPASSAIAPERSRAACSTALHSGAVADVGREQRPVPVTPARCSTPTSSTSGRTLRGRPRTVSPRIACIRTPPYTPGAGRAEFRGRAELLAGFVRRGYKSYQLPVRGRRSSAAPSACIEGTAKRHRARRLVPVEPVARRRWPHPPVRDVLLRAAGQRR